MKRRSRGKSAPSYRRHKASGQAVVTINGRTYYLGKIDTPESREKYQRLLTELWSPVGCSPKSPVPKRESPSITRLAIEYVKHAKNYYQKNGQPTSEFVAAQRVLKRLRSIYGSLPASEFGPLKYQAFRQTFIDDGLARSTINHYMWHVRKMFQHAGRLEIVPMSHYRDLDAVGNLLQGRSEARETDDVLPVDDAILNATIDKLRRPLADMVKLQLLTGMRPGEVRNLRPCDIDRSNDVWIYRPPTHKNEHKKSRKAKTRIVMIGPKAQLLLRPYLLRDHQAWCFSPLEIDSRAKEAYYTKDAYRRAINRAALRAFPYPKKIKKNKAAMKAWRQKYSWSPNRLRHNAATLARKLHGLETAQQILGHTESRTTEMYYAEIDSELAIEFARKNG